MQLHGWGRFPVVDAEVVEPINADSLQALLGAKKKQASLIARGAGKSYGDSALANRVLSSRFLDSYITLDEENNRMRCGAGVMLDSILKLTVPRGWFLPVLPGTKWVSVGGAIAADVHGKNHHLDGSFCDHIVELSLATASGEILVCNRKQNSDVFHATCGGMGLTGVILDATLNFDKVSSVLINRQSLPADNIEHCFELIEEHTECKYSVAWLDCLASGTKLGRSVLHLGEHAVDGKLQYKARRGPSIPFSTPGFLLNRFTMSLFNSTLYSLRKLGKENSTINYDAYFFPLDNIDNWNRLYGSKGFLQYQFVLPQEAALEGMREILQKVSAAGKGSFLAVLKKFGKANKNLLSFPMGGYTLTLDFKWEKQIFPLLDELDQIVIDKGGRHYLAKDARMSEAVFKAGYPKWKKFLAVKHQLDPDNIFASHQSDRIGLTG
ncbi:MAG: FAD-binding oxidoreductase [Gammaproteobacteria bacterium]|jgi:FAD/FMN-containing dehydrogenase|nr:FAD-binding oxidoreductase [Gammaproteobacteria bacterium]MDP6731257.1 FAD-binding oxidoreductase [Gammaproteobacteria bacterium]|tara:strand:- start:563 stop:1876 length:1314 start_codon:yes stop_codon:yes gene_type:complete